MCSRPRSRRNPTGHLLALGSKRDVIGLEKEGDVFLSFTSLCFIIKITNYGHLTQGSGTVEEEKCEVPTVDPEVEAWSERTAVITRYDHETHCHLARGFVEDLADKVVADNWKEPEPKKEESEPSISLNLKKQKLFLPDLVPNVVVSVPNTETVSESDEYESADEQPQQLHGLSWFHRQKQTF